MARRPLLSFLASLVGLWTFLALTGAWVVSTAQLAPGVPLALVTCALLTIANLIYARARGRGRAAVLGLAALVPLVCGAEYSLDSVLGWLPYDGPSIVLVVGIVGYGCALLVARAAVHFLAQPPVRFGLDMSRLAAALVIAACASGAGLAVQKRLTHDDPVAWRARTMDLGFLGLHTVSGAIVPSPPCRYLGEPATRTCPPSVRGVLSNHSEDGVSPLPDARHTCHVDVSDETGRARALTLEEVPSARPCSSFELRRVAGTMWIAIPGVRYDDASFHTFVDPEDADRPILSLDGLAPWLAPPLPWSLSALAGVLAAIALLLIPHDRRLRERLTWREETRDGLVLLVNPLTPAETYRTALDASDARWVVPSTRATARLVWQRVRAGRWAFAGMTALVFSAPLLVAAMRGLLG